MKRFFIVLIAIMLFFTTVSPITAYAASIPVYYNSYTDLRDSHLDVGDWGASCFTCSTAMIFSSKGFPNATPYDIWLANGGTSTVKSWSNLCNQYGLTTSSGSFGGSENDIKAQIIELCHSHPEGVLLSGDPNGEADTHAVVAFVDDYDNIYYHDPGSKGWNSQTIGSYFFSSYTQFDTWRVFHGGPSTVLVDLGTDFYGIILNTAAWKPITVGSDGLITMQTEIGHANQVWKFTRQDDGSYIIASALTGNLLEMHAGDTTVGTQTAAASKDQGENYQRWFIYYLGNGYVLQSKHNADLNLVLDMANNDSTNGTAVTICTRNNSNAQMWSIYTRDDVQLKAPTLSVVAGSSSTDTIFTRNEVYGESSYTLNIWKNTAGDGAADYCIENAVSGCGITLPAGTYQASLTAANYFLSQTSNIVTFTVISDCEHTFGSWSITTPASCTTDGLRTRVCTGCGFEETQSISATEHDWYVSDTVLATCQEPRTLIYSCNRCTEQKTEQDRIVWSNWAESVPDGLSSSAVESKTQYRYSDQESNWAQTESGTVDYVASWPSGFNTGNSLYGQYHNAPVDDSLTDTRQVTVTSNDVIGYINYHWCRGYAYGPINRRVNDYNDGTYTYFHAFFTTSAGSDYDSSGSYGEGSKYYYNPDCCTDSWWYLQIPVYRQNYTVQELQFSGERWTDWSTWSDESVIATDTRKVETRALYRYATEGLGNHSWENGVCSVCGERNLDYVPQKTKISRLSGSGRCETAYAVADELKTVMGVDAFNTIVIAGGDNFADALAGSYLAAAKDAPILLYRKGYEDENLKYITENLVDGGTVYILGGTNTVSQAMEDVLGDYEVVRLAGSDRYLTNLAILAEAGISEGQEILVATGLNFADSLSASATGLPILLVNNNAGKLTAEQIDFLAGLGGANMTIVGGTGSVSETLADALSDYGTVTRVSGSSRELTSVEVAKAFVVNPSVAVLAYSRNFPDGLCGGPLAHALGAPLLLTNAKAEAPATAYIAENGITEGYIMGGTAALSDETVRTVFAMTADDEIFVK